MSSRTLSEEASYASRYSEEDVMDVAELKQQIAELTAQLASLHEKVDELLTDTRKVRPLMNQFLNSPMAKLPGFQRKMK